MTPLRPPKGQKMLVKLPFWKVPGEKVGVWDHVIMYPMPTPENPQFFFPPGVSSRTTLESWSLGALGWKSPMGWVDTLDGTGWLVEEILPCAKECKKFSKNNLTDCGSWLPSIFFWFFFLKMLLVIPEPIAKNHAQALGWLPPRTY